MKFTHSDQPQNAPAAAGLQTRTRLLYTKETAPPNPYSLEMTGRGAAAGRVLSDRSSRGLVQ